MCKNIFNFNNSNDPNGPGKIQFPSTYDDEFEEDSFTETEEVEYSEIDYGEDKA